LRILKKILGAIFGAVFGALIGVLLAGLVSDNDNIIMTCAALMALPGARLGWRWGEEVVEAIFDQLFGRQLSRFLD
jgi:hypothetical protein